MKTTAGLAAHTFELYGLAEPPRSALMLYGLDGHAGCDLLTFCRNPLHPGPCKGWKDRLKVVAPGVHKMIEDDRKAKVQARRDAKGKGGKGRDGDGDGKKGEDDSEKPAKKPRRKAKDDEPKEPYADDGHAVKLRPETRALVAAATKALPKNDKGWRDLTGQQVQAVEPSIAKLKRAALTRYQDNILARDKARDRYAGRIKPGMTWEELLARDPDEADWYQGNDGKFYDRELADAKEALELVTDAVTKGDAEIARLGGLKPDGTVPDGFVPEPGFRASSFERQSSWQRIDYPKDANGANLPPPELVKMHAAVQKAGDAIRTDLQAAIAEDPEAKRLKAEYEAGNYDAFDYTANSDSDKRRRARDRAEQAKSALRRRERELVVDALDQFRPMGGSKIDNAVPVLLQSDIGALHPGGKPARRDWRAQLDSTAKYLPNDWVERSNSTPLTVVSSDRAYHLSLSDWRNANQGATTLSMSSEKVSAGAFYDGAFRDSAEEVSLHEFGHRMESQIPGLKALEFAYVRSKTTLANGNVEPQVKLKDVYGGGYDDYEVAYKDKFPNMYTGKTYEGSVGNGDPVNESWEAFQVGLQDTFGRGSTKYGEPDLESFVLGAMATLGKG